MRRVWNKVGYMVVAFTKNGICALSHLDDMQGALIRFDEYVTAYACGVNGVKYDIRLISSITGKTIKKTKIKTVIEF